MASLLARKFRDEANHETKMGKNVLRRFLIDNAPKLKYVEAMERFDRASRGFRVAEMPHRAVECDRLAQDMCVRQVTAAELNLRKDIFTSGFAPAGELEGLVFAIRAAELEAARDGEAAREAYRAAIRTCCDLGEFEVAGDLQRRIVDSLREDRGGTNYSFKHGDRADLVRLERTAADLYGAAVTRNFNEAKAAAQRRALVDAALLDATPGEEARYVRSAETLEAVAYELLRDNLSAARAVRLFFKAGLCYLVAGGDDNVMRGKLHLFSNAHVDFALSAERSFLLDINEALLNKPLPLYDTFVDLAYHLNTLKKLDSFELLMLAELNDTAADVIHDHAQHVAHNKARQAANKQRRKERRDRERRVARDQATLDKQRRRVR